MELEYYRKTLFRDDWSKFIRIYTCWNCWSKFLLFNLTRNDKSKRYGSHHHQWYYDLLLLLNIFYNFFLNALPSSWAEMCTLNMPPAFCPPDGWVMVWIGGGLGIDSSTPQTAWNSGVDRNELRYEWKISSKLIVLMIQIWINGI